jgi:hypothetical protein
LYVKFRYDGDVGVISGTSAADFLRDFEPAGNAQATPEVGSRWKRVTRKPGTMGMNPVAIVTRRSTDGRVMYSFNHNVDTVADFLRDFEPAGDA